jgi:aminopeptidase N
MLILYDSTSLNPNFSPILKRKLLMATDLLYKAQNSKKETE